MLVNCRLWFGEDFNIDMSLSFYSDQNLGHELTKLLDPNAPLVQYLKKNYSVTAKRSHLKSLQLEWDEYGSTSEIPFSMFDHSLHSPFLVKDLPRAGAAIFHIEFYDGV